MISLEFQNYLRAQPGHTTSVNLINCTVDYLLRLQESVMDFYWHYSSKDVIDESGKEYFLRAIHVCSQVFNTLTESIQVSSIYYPFFNEIDYEKFIMSKFYKEQKDGYWSEGSR